MRVVRLGSLATPRARALANLLLAPRTMGGGCFDTLWRRFERANAARWPWGHLAGWRGPSGFGSRTVAAEVLPAASTGAPPPLAGRVAIVTGANSGIGLETARALALGGARVVLACRDPTAAARAADDIRRENPRALVIILPLDLASFASVRAFADAFLALALPLHILVHNAGIMPCPFQLTPDGHELAFQVNYLSPRLLTRRLLPRLRAVAGPEDFAVSRRVVHVVSAAHRYAYPRGVRLDRLSGPAASVGHDPIRSYGQSKLAATSDAFESNARFAALRRAGDAEVFVYAAHPGAVRTRGSERARLESGGWRGWVLHRLGKPFLKTTAAGAATATYAATAPERDARRLAGKYLVNCNVARASAAARSPAFAKRLREKADAMLSNA